MLQSSLCKDVTPFIWLKDLNVAYQHYSDNDGVCGQDDESLIIQSVPLWAGTESTAVTAPNITDTPPGKKNGHNYLEFHRGVCMELQINAVSDSFHVSVGM